MTRLDALMRQVADEQDALRARSNLADRLVHRLGDAPAPKSRVRRKWIFPVAALVAAAGVALALVARTSELGVRVGHSAETALVGAWLGAPDTKPLPLEFSDGSRFELAPRARARLVELHSNGARVELASGRVRVHVVPKRTTDFRLVAGPFVVHVTGTRFEMGYTPERDAFELYLEEGQVEIQGCVFGRGRMVAAGQSVKASCKEPALDVRYGPPRPSESVAVRAPALAAGAPPPNPPTPRATEPAPEAPRGTVSERRPAPSASVAAAAPSWRALAAAGSYREALSAVEAQGFEAECARSNADALGLLADVARHAGAPRRAELALLTLRGRFPASSDAALAAFTLGRLEFDEYRSYGRAATWFETYLRERPSGSMAREALGRVMEARERAGDRAGAREIAARYLREYPSGPHAELASRLASP